MNETREHDFLLRELEPIEQRGRLASVLACLIMASPLVFTFGIEVALRFAQDARHPMPKPWVERTSPFFANADLAPKDGWGDLVRRARLPYYSELLASGPDRSLLWQTDARGFLNASDDNRQIEITLLGASFMTAGSSGSHTFGGQLSKATGKRVDNIAWPGRGPVHAALRLIEGQHLVASEGPIVVYGIVQRALRAELFQPLLRRLDKNGKPIGSAAVGLKTKVRRWLRWSQSLEDWLGRSSSVVAESDRIARWLPPLVFDRGMTSPVKLARLTQAPHRGKPILFYNEEIASARQDWAARDGDTVVETLRRFHAFCHSHSVRFLVVLIPDKFEFYQDRLRPLNFRWTRRDTPPITARFARQLRAAGVNALDLYPALRRAQFDPPQKTLVYRPDDTHWADEGIEAAAKAVAIELKRPG